MTEVIRIEISRALARQLAETRHTWAFRELMRIFKSLSNAAEEEQKAKIYNGPAYRELMRFIRVQEAFAEVEGHPWQGNLYSQPVPTAPTSCYYCGEPSTGGRLCAACTELFQALQRGEKDLPDRYKKDEELRKESRNSAAGKRDFRLNTECQFRKLERGLAPFQSSANL